MEGARPARLESSLFLKEKGFTLVELMVIMAIAATLIGFAYTGFSGSMERQRCQAAVKRITWVLKQAQMQAIEKHASCAVVADSGTETIRVFLDYYPDNAPNMTFDGNDTLLESIDMAKDYRDVEIKQGASFRFNNRGIPKGALPKIKVNLKNSTWEDGNVTVSNVGRIYAEMPDGWSY